LLKRLRSLLQLTQFDGISFCKLAVEQRFSVSLKMFDQIPGFSIDWKSFVTSKNGIAMIEQIATEEFGLTVKYHKAHAWPWIGELIFTPLQPRSLTNG
jgi:hypothetical protein